MSVKLSPEAPVYTVVHVVPPSVVPNRMSPPQTKPLDASVNNTPRKLAIMVDECLSVQVAPPSVDRNAFPSTPGYSYPTAQIVLLSIYSIVLATKLPPSIRL